MRRNGVLLALGLLIGVGAALWFVRPLKKDLAGEAISPQMLTRAVQIVALAENGFDYRGAMAGWTELLSARPNDRDLLLNQAVTVLKWISDTNSTLSSGSVTDASKLEALQSQLQDAYAEADRVLARLVATQGAGDEATGKQVLLESVLLETRSRDQSDEQSLALRQQATEKLLAALKQRPDQLWLVGRLIDLAEELQLDWPEVTPRATEAIYQAWKSTPRNMLLLVRAGEGLLEQKDARLLEVLTASLELSQPLLPMLPDATRIQPAELIKTVSQQVSAGDWSRAARVRAWLNILRSSSAFQSDRRLVNPDFMALLNTSFLEKWRVAVSQASAVQPTAKPTVVVTSIVSSVERIPNSAQREPTLPDAEPMASRLAWYDYDVDREFEIVALQGNQLRLIDPKSPAVALSELTLPFVPTGLVIVDLWSVDNPQRPRIDRTLATSPATPTLPDAAPADNSLSHDTIQEIVLWDRSKVIVVAPKPNVDPSAPTDPNPWIIHDQVPGLASLTSVRQVLPMELESDGDLDLVISTDSGLQLLQNNGNRTFEDVTAFSSLPPAGWQPTSLVACDYDRDLDMDLVCSSATAPYLAVLENILHSQLRFREFDQGEQPIDAAAANLAVAELDGNASWDWCVLTQTGVESLLTRTTAPGQLYVTSRIRLNLPEAKPIETKSTETMRVCDLNLDGWLDVCVAGAGGLNAYLGDGQRFSATPHGLIGQAVVGLDVQDIDGDGPLELLTSVDGEVRVVKVSPASSGHYLSARVRGISDNKGGNNNHYGYGGVVELWAGGRYQARVIDSPQVHFGLPAQKADDLRVIFTNGLTQNVMDPEVDSLVQQRQELKGSCPFVYGWDGQRFQLITDLLWNAPLGLQTARGQVLPDRRWEHLLLPGALVQPRDGAIELRVTEELWEVAYFDQVSLAAIDHPSSVEVWTNEKVGPPQLAQPRLFTASRPIRPTTARDGYDRDVLPALLVRDREYVQAFDRQICQGLCEPHFIELTFDPRQLGLRNDLRLVLTGWMHPTDTSLNVGLAQNDQLQLPAPPSLWAPDATGQFVCKQPFMGFPGGKPKTIVIDLSDVFTGDDTRLRIASTQQLYWDEAYIVADEPPTPVRVQPLRLLSAELRYRGFGQLLPRASDQPHWYDYTQVSTSAKWPPLEGLFTRYGDVLPQIHSDDDRLVVMASGDEMILRFELPQAVLPDEWQRDYELHSVGWDKDADLNTLEGQSSLPLPYSRMQRYPPPIEQAVESEAVWQANSGTLVPRDLYRRFWSTTRR